LISAVPVSWQCFPEQDAEPDDETAATAAAVPRNCRRDIVAGSCGPPGDMLYGESGGLHRQPRRPRSRLDGCRFRTDKCWSFAPISSRPRLV
jgi:hypothetical protein